MNVHLCFILGDFIKEIRLAKKELIPKEFKSHSDFGLVAVQGKNNKLILVTHPEINRIYELQLNEEVKGGIHFLNLEMIARYFLGAKLFSKEDKKMRLDIELHENTDTPLSKNMQEKLARQWQRERPKDKLEKFPTDYPWDLDYWRIVSSKETEKNFSFHYSHDFSKGNIYTTGSNLQLKAEEWLQKATRGA
jgi:hypothetical protein